MRQKVARMRLRSLFALLLFFQLSLTCPSPSVLSSNLFHAPSQAENCAFAASCRWVATEVHPQGLSKVSPNRITSSTSRQIGVTCLVRLQVGLSPHLSPTSPEVGLMGINQFVALLAALIDKFLASL